VEEEIIEKPELCLLRAELSGSVLEVVIAIESNEDICLSNNVEAINGWV
jgi:hypothetical protein